MIENPLIKWSVAPTTKPCNECDEPISRGQKQAAYIDIVPMIYGKPIRVKKVYCAGCAVDLAASLTTTGDIN